MYNGFQLPDASAHNRETMRAALDLSEKALVAASVGRLTRENGVDVLIQGLGAVTRSSDSVHCVVVGTGPEEDSLRRLAKNLDFATCIRFLGFREDAIDILEASDLCVVPSHWEGLPYAAIEAISVGLPGGCERCGRVTGDRWGGVQAPGASRQPPRARPCDLRSSA